MAKIFLKWMKLRKKKAENSLFLAFEPPWISIAGTAFRLNNFSIFERKPDHFINQAENSFKMPLIFDAKVYEIKRKSEGNPDRIKAILRDEYNIVI